MEKILTEEEAQKLTGRGRSPLHVIIPEGYTVIGKHAFVGHRELVSVEVPKGVKVIEHSAFSCMKLKNVILPEGLEVIGSNAFGSCMEMESITIPESVKIIGDSAFAFCEKLQNINLPQGLIAIGGGAFVRAALRSVTIPASVKYMYPYESQLAELGTDFERSVYLDEVFPGCYELTEINVDPDNETFASVDGVLFTKDMSILLDYPAGKPQTSYTIPDGVKEINHASFGGCCNLESIIIPESVTEIDDEAFLYCKNLVSITIPRNVTRIEASAFSDCESLTDIYVDEENPCFSSIDGVLVSKDRAVLLRYPEGRTNTKTEYTIPESITSIKYSAFTYHKKDNDDKTTIKITVHDNVKDIDKWDAFYNKEHFVICCREGSPAHKHAAEEKIAFELM